MKKTVFFLIFTLTLALTLSVSLPSFAALDERTAGTKKEEDPYKYHKLFGDVLERVKQLYVDEKDYEALIEHAITGMLAGLDPHSAYLNSDSFDDMKIQTRGSFGGLGIEVTMDNGLVKVVSPIDDTPAYKAGVEAGDLVTHLDGSPVIGLSLSEAVEKMRGKVGTTIELTIRREKEPEALKIKIKRAIIKIKSVRHRVEGDIGYIRITTFNQQTSPGLKKAIKDLKRKMKKDLLGYVIDLRNNPGGLLTEAITVSDAFLNEGEIVSTRGRHEEDTKRDMATQGDMADGLPLVVLINGGSASASEIVAGALQDHRRAVVMGTQSFGKGSVQTVIPLPEDGAMRLTTARYFTPSGRSIQAKGIVPDIIVELARVENLENGDAIKESDLKGALKNGDEKETDNPDGLPDIRNKLSDKAKEDYQLLRAIDLLRGVALYNSQHPVITLDKKESATETAEK